MNKDEIQNQYWSYFLDWLEDASFDPRNGEHIGTIFWYWWLTVAKRGAGLEISDE